MISYHEALALIQAQAKNNLLGAETVAVTEIAGRLCAEKIRAPLANQPFDNSAMDGFALQAEELTQAANDNPVALEMIGHIAAGGRLATRPPARGQCYEIMTGAPLPPGCDTVVPVEKTEKDGQGRILFRTTALKGDNIRRAGADFSAGDDVLDPGTELLPGHILALATLGIGAVKVARRAKAGWISTGTEIMDDLDTPLKAGQIYNSTGPYLRAKLPQMGVESLPLGTVADNPAAYKEKLLQAVQEGCNIILSTGAVSAGVHDFVPEVLKEMGARIFFHKVSIRPGKPILFAQLPQGGPFFLGLPGNPVSTAVGLRFFAQPLLRAMQGLPSEKAEYAVLAEDYNKKKIELRFFVRALQKISDAGLNEIRVIPNQQSFMVKPFVQSNIWATVPEDVNSLKKGDIIQVYRD